jgi:lipopolysaccharide/colanic/teichoic acid biosynthesis glycosyltransferase
MQAADESSSDASLSGLVYCNSRAKRWLDIAGAVIGLATLMPVFALAALIVRFVDGLPPIYRQERFGFRRQTLYHPQTLYAAPGRKSGGGHVRTHPA